MSNKRQRPQQQQRRTAAAAMASAKRQARCDHVNFVVLVSVAVLLPLLAAYRPADGAKLQDAQLKLLINDDELLLLQEPKPAAAAPEAAQAELEHDHERYNLYRSELKRLSYETIHRILRDENEPIYRREDAELRYYQKRSYQPTHEVVRRSASALPAAQTHPPSQHFLNLAHAQLRHFDAARDFDGDPASITEIDLSSNQLTQPNLSAFAALQIVNLSNNSLQALPHVAPSSVVALNLNANRIRTGTAPRSPHLRELHLSANDIENLATLNLSMLSALETLDLSCNRIENLETAFFPQRMHNLKHLNLAHNRLGSIYRETFYNLLSLNTLLLTHNNISDIDYETFLALPNLQYLDLSHNQLKGESIRALQGIPDLVRLSIAHNPEVGASMQEFVASWSLKELDASGTGLCQIPAALAQSVRTLKLTDNWLKIINCGDLDSYPLLQYLDLSHSRIEDIEDDALGRLEILEVLFLDHNKLRKVPVSLPTSLEHLFLQHNAIMDIQVQSFQGLNSLQTLDLSGNQLLYLPALPLPKLLTLNVQAAGLKGVSQAIVHTLPRLRDLLLEENPIKCSDLLSIAEWASPCRMTERSSNNNGDAFGNYINVNANANTIAGDLVGDNRVGGIIATADVGQQQQQEEEEQQPLAEAAKIDLKQKFVRMHNFFEKFRSNCGAQRQMMLANVMPPPECASELDATTVEATETVADGGGTQRRPATVLEAEAKTEAASFNLPTELQRSGNAAVANTQASARTWQQRAPRLGGKVFEFNQKNSTAEMAKSLRAKVANDDKAVEAVAATAAADVRRNAVATLAPATATAAATRGGPTQTSPIRLMNSERAAAPTVLLPRASALSVGSSSDSNNKNLTAKTLRQTAATPPAATTTIAATTHLLRQQITALPVGSATKTTAATRTTAMQYTTATPTTDTEQQPNQDERGTTAWSQTLAGQRQHALATATKTTPTTTTITTTDSDVKTAATANGEAAAAAINFTHTPKQQQQQQQVAVTWTIPTTTLLPQLASTSSLNNGERISQPENVDTAKNTPGSNQPSSGLTSATTAAQHETIHLPRTISSTIRSGNNYTGRAATATATRTTTATTTGLLSQKGFKTTATAAATTAATEAAPATAYMTATAALATTTTTTTATGETTTTGATAKAAVTAEADAAGKAEMVMDTRVDKDSTRNDSADNNKVVENRLLQQQRADHNFKRANPNFNDISGRWRMGATPALPAEGTILAQPEQRQHQSELLPTTTPTTTMTAMHKHEPLQLHIKDRHLIGTPLLMHKGQNMLVEAKRLMLPTVTKATTTTTTTNTMRTLTTPTTTAKTVELAKSQEQQQQQQEQQQQQPLLEAANNPFAEGPQQVMATGSGSDKQTAAVNGQPNGSNDAPANHQLTGREDKQMTATATTTTSHMSTTEHAAKQQHWTSDRSTHKKHAGTTGEQKRKPSLTMRKMTITKHSNPQKHQQQPQNAHYTLNTPRGNGAATGRDAKHPDEHVPTATNEGGATTGHMPAVAPHKHSTVNTPIVHGQQQPEQRPRQALGERQSAAELINEAPHSATSIASLHGAAHSRDERVSKSEQWLDMRRATTTGHPGVVILLSFSLFVVLLVGLMHVYRCDMPWRRHLSPQQRPHQRHLNEDDAHSFLNYQSSSSSGGGGGVERPHAHSNIQRWHHSLRSQPPYSSPLYNLHVRELQKTSAVEGANRSVPAPGTRAPYGTSVHYATVASAATAGSDGSRTSSSLSSSRSSAILDADDAFYVEMSPDAAPVASDAMHVDMLPMELLSVSAASRRRDSDRLQQTPERRSTPHATGKPTTAAAGCSEPHSGSNTASVQPLGNVKLAAASTRKFDLW